MVLIPILTGVYFIMMVGYYRLTMRVITENRTKSDSSFEGYPSSTLKLASALLAVVWPLSLMYTLLREALVYK